MMLSKNSDVRAQIRFHPQLMQGLRRDFKSGDRRLTGRDIDLNRATASLKLDTLSQLEKLSQTPRLAGHLAFQPSLRDAFFQINSNLYYLDRVVSEFTQRLSELSEDIRNAHPRNQQQRLEKNLLCDRYNLLRSQLANAVEALGHFNRFQL